MRALWLIPLLLLPIGLPVASAQCASSPCVDAWGASSGSCSTQGFQHNEVEAKAAGGHVVVKTRCSTSGSTRTDQVFVHADTEQTNKLSIWWIKAGLCQVYVWTPASSTPQVFPCPADPPRVPQIFA